MPGIVRVQIGKLSGLGNGSSIACTVNGIAPGSLVVGNVTCGDVAGGGATLSTLRDDLNVDATPTTSVDWSVGTQNIYQRHWANYGGGTRTFTATFSTATAPFRGIVIAEYSGADTAAPLGPANTNVGTSAAPSSGAVTPAKDGALLVGYAVTANLPSAVAPFTDLWQDTTLLADSEDYIQPTAASIAATWTQTSGTWGAIVGAYYPASAGARPSSRSFAIQQRAG